MLSRSSLRGLACTCQLQSTSARVFFAVRNASTDASATETSSYDLVPHFDENGHEEDFHNRRQARHLTARLKKTKERRVKRGKDFVDKIFVQAAAGKGGDGGVAFHTEKFVPKGPPSGGNGGQGGNVYIRPVPHLSSLSSIQRRLKAHNGQPGSGSWLHGARGKDLVIEVPYGTVVREHRDTNAQDSEEGQEGLLSESWNDWRRRMKREELELPEAAKERRERLFVLYPGLTEDKQQHEVDRMSELAITLLGEERREAMRRLQRPLLELDFDKLPADQENGTVPEAEKVLILQGGQGGYGNPYFTALDVRRAPKIATRGKPGEVMRLELELKTLADIGLVGLPNAGKSTLLRSLTYSKSTIDSYAFTTLSPQIGTLILYDDDTYSTFNASDPIEDSRMTDPDQPRSRLLRPARKEARQERLRLTIADCPGLLPGASEDVGLGHTFLRHIERSQVLVYVVDLTSKSPELDLRVLREELDAYTPELSKRAKIIVANKADKIDSEDPEAVEAIKGRLDALRRIAMEWQESDGIARTVLPMSAKMRGNVAPLVSALSTEFAGE